MNFYIFHIYCFVFLKYFVIETKTTHFFSRSGLIFLFITCLILSEHLAENKDLVNQKVTEVILKLSNGISQCKIL